MFLEALLMTVMTIIAIVSFGYLLFSFGNLVDKYPWLIFVCLGVLVFVAILIGWIQYLSVGG